MCVLTLHPIGIYQLYSRRYPGFVRYTTCRKLVSAKHPIHAGIEPGNSARAQPGSSASTKLRSSGGTKLGTNAGTGQRRSIGDVLRAGTS